MKKLINIILIALGAVLAISSQSRAQTATVEQALTVAENWGGFESAHVEQIHEFTQDSRLLGYCCRVNPTGFVVVSVRKEMAPVKAYSVSGFLDPADVQGLADLLKGRMKRMLDAIEQQPTPNESVTDPKAQSTVRIDYRPVWDELIALVPRTKEGTESVTTTFNYDGGEPPLLTSRWKQTRPYNEKCPDMADCTNPKLNGHPYAGCVAIAGAQVMRYWAWPPYGQGPSPLKGGEPYNDPYDWANMPDSLTASPPPTQAQIDAVAELCDEVGDSVKTAYGCTVSNAFITCDFIPICTCALEDAMKLNFRYSMNLDVEFSWDIGSDKWFEIIKGQLNLNRPLPYSCLTPGAHVIVVDGWQVLSGPIGPIKQFHMNYGWGGWVPPPTDPNTDPNWYDYTDSNTWYTLDALPGSDALVLIQA